ncbi:GRAS family transcription factor [Striga asiatica]|uniref:GRAS family transcription factor n=1 Tax=Striga asiatica TaxID=4170 RepID=A0A5A7Q712_STRAF|nr:GRAS family transcription factor [Striga asiatica]
MFQEDGSSSVTSTPFQALPMTSPSPGPNSPYPWLKDLKPEERGLYLIHLLITCASHVSSGGLDLANMVLDQMSQLASPAGDTMQRIASYFSEALADRALRSWPGLYKAFRSTNETPFPDKFLAWKMFSEFLPFMKAAFVIGNQAIVEAMEGEKMVHVVDLNAIEPVQWCSLIRDLSARPEGPPHLRITGIHPNKEVLEKMANVLTHEAEKLDLPFQFNPIVTTLESLDLETLRVKTGEALAVSSVLQLHSLLASNNNNNNNNNNSFSNKYPMVGNRRSSPSNDSSFSSSPLSSSKPSSRLDSFLSALRGLSPKIMVVAEQDSDHNGKSLMERMSESLYFYAALFDCLESTLPRASLERLKMEKVLFGEEIKNIIACEGSERMERHEKLEKWGRRLDLAGFGNVALSYYAMLQGKRLVQGFKCEGYRIKEENGCVVICWYDRPLYSVSAWRFRR